jgi:hypothetical protein
MCAEKAREDVLSADSSVCAIVLLGDALSAVFELFLVFGGSNMS